ncbi:unnamed protein product [Zymoseptoria tritici ST99CH_1E4]|uniref:Peptidase A1 domain-containing protein n=1 Tax=Zymoseptoria tritici ST99CH_1E4 TaxID=1276532 RepID=A0A2H1GUK6_ZYMTR|nr:unnamed protein product [Zymoseptoria tritici ST99CH_1E4]
MKKRLFYSLKLVLASLRLAAGQTSNEDTTTPLWALASKLEAGSSTICGKKFEDANATGIFYINPNVLQGPQTGQQNTGRTQDSGLAVTVHSAPDIGNSSLNATSSSYGLWYNTFGANYSGDFSLGYDVCAILGFSLNYNTLLRGQDDDGTCSSALDEKCSNALAAVTEQHANWLTTPDRIGPGSNLTNTSLPGLCNTLAGNLRDNFPRDCSYFFDESAVQALGFPLTSNGENYNTVLNPNCTLNETWQGAVSIYNNNSESVYTSWIQAVTPLLFVFMPVADFAQNIATTRISSSKAELSCLRIENIRADSLKPSPAPEPTPVAYNVTSTPAPAPASTESSVVEISLTVGDIVGIVVGIIAAIVLVVGGVVIYRWRKRKARRLTAQSDTNTGGLGGEKAELPGESSKKLGPGKVHELGVDGSQVGELEAKDKAFQLPATVEEGGKMEPLELAGDEGQKKEGGQPRIAELP